MERVYGAVTRINYYDEDQGFGIVKIKLDYRDKELAKYRETLFSNSLTVLSNFDRKPIIDEEFEFEGNFETSSYGIQFRAKAFKRRNEQSKESIVTYLSSDYFPGVGKVAATKVFEALGSSCLTEIPKDKSLLDKVKINNAQKKTIYENLYKNQEDEKQLLNLLDLGISLRMAVRIINILGDEAYEIVKENPYKLIDLVEGIGFVRADGIAMNMGIPIDSPLRLKALIIYVLDRHIRNSGDTYIDASELYLEASKVLDDGVLNKTNFADFVNELATEHKIIIEDNNIYEYKVYNEEYLLARKVYDFLQNEPFNRDETEVLSKINKVMVKNKIEYSKMQIEAIKKAIIEPIVIITGGPGTGKSTIIKGIIDTYCSLFENSDIIKESIKLVAPTGRASKRLNEVTKHQASTIHKLLGYSGTFFAVTPESPIQAKMIIIDEFSMVDISLAAYLFSVITADTKIVIVGDADQLPSVGPGNVLKDLIDCKEITTIRLQEIHRQAQDSTIISLAHDINQGRLPEDLLKLQKDRSFIRSSNDNIIPFMEKTIAQAMENEGMDLVNDIQVLAPMYKGSVGIDAINFSLQQRFNPNPFVITHQGKKFKINDKVIQLVNRNEKNVMNGDIGYIFSIDKTNEKIEKVTVMFDFGAVDYKKEELDDLSLAYAISIHKSQGSEFPLVIMPFSFKYYIMLKRKLIYTGVTRAKKYLIMLGDYEAIRKGIVETEEERKTKLVLRIQEIFANPNKIHDPKSAFLEIDDEDDDLENISPYDFM